jgi:protein-disulfide isomerase
MKLRSLAAFAAAFLLVPFAGSLAHAQVSVPPGQAGPFRDTSMLKLPAGAPVAIFEFEDLECPACAHDAPIIRGAIQRYKIPYLHHDYPLPMHKWSKDAAITARYLQDKVDPSAAEMFRLDVFQNQMKIASKDDLQNMTRKWFTAHKLQMPFVMDPSGLFLAEVNADHTLGDRLGVQHTPTIFVLTQHGWIQIEDITQLYSTLDTAIAEAKPAAAAVHNNVKKPAAAKQ